MYTHVPRTYTPKEPRAIAVTGRVFKEREEASLSVIADSEEGKEREDDIAEGE